MFVLSRFVNVHFRCIICIFLFLPLLPQKVPHKNSPGDMLQLSEERQGCIHSTSQRTSYSLSPFQLRKFLPLLGPLCHTPFLLRCTLPRYDSHALGFLQASFIVQSAAVKHSHPRFPSFLLECGN